MKTKSISFKSFVCSFHNRLENIVIGSRKGIEDVIVSMVPQAFSVLAGFLISVLIARGLGPKGMGNYALILSVSGLAAALSDLGIGQTAIRYASRAASKNDTENQLAILRWAFRLRMFLVLLTSTIAFIFAPILANKVWQAENLTFLTRLSLLTSIFAAVATVPTIYFQSLKRFKMNAIVSVGQTLVLLVGIFIIALLNNWSLEQVVAVSVIAAGIGSFTFIMLVPKSSVFKFDDLKLSKSLKLNKLWQAPDDNTINSESFDNNSVNSFALYMFLSSLIVTLIMRADVWLMGLYVEKSQIGLYSVATRFTLPLIIVLSALNTALWPRSSALTCALKTTDLLSKTFRLSIVVAFIGIIYSISAPLLTPWIFGSAYESGVLMGQILCLRYCLSILTCPIGVIGYSFGLVKVYWWINLLQLIVVVGINLILLPKIGVIGSALALIANEMIGFMISGAIIWRKLNTIKGLPVYE